MAQAGNNGANGSPSGTAGSGREELAEQELLPDVVQGEIAGLAASAAGAALHPAARRATPRPHWSRRWKSTASAGPAPMPRSFRRSWIAAMCERAERKLVPTDLGFTVNDLLVKHFDSIFNVGFTASMEEHLDSIASGRGGDGAGAARVLRVFEPQLQHAERTMEKVAVEPEKIGETCPECGGDLVIKSGRFGRFVGVQQLSDVPLHQAASDQARCGLPKGRRRSDRAAHSQGPRLLRLRQLSRLRLCRVEAPIATAVPELQRNAGGGVEIHGRVFELPRARVPGRIAGRGRTRARDDDLNASGEPACKRSSTAISRI